MVNKSREFQIFVKPSGAECNLRCGYCYYLKNERLSDRSTLHTMARPLLEKYIRDHIEASNDEIINFSWHGGEPLLATMSFYRRVVALQKMYKPSGRHIINGIQTNGTLIDEEWCRFLSEENFIVGISIDGPADLHDQFRVDRNGEPSHSKVMRGYELLLKHNIQNEVLCVVHAGNVSHPLTVYEFFRKLGTHYITFLPLVVQQEGSPGGVAGYSVPPEDFGAFLCSIFDEWVENDIGKIKIQVIEEALRAAFNQEHTLCIFKVNCGGVPVLERNGDFYSCDHYVSPEYLIGNISNRSIAEMLDSPGQKAFGNRKSGTLPRYCLECAVKVMCNGECPKNRFILTPGGEPGLNYLCAGYKLFFTHCLPYGEAIKVAHSGQQTP